MSASRASLSSRRAPCLISRLQPSICKGCRILPARVIGNSLNYNPTPPKLHADAPLTLMVYCQRQPRQTEVAKRGNAKTYLAWACLRSRGSRCLGKYVMARRDGTAGLLSIARPVGAWLCIQTGTSGVGILVRHILRSGCAVGGILGVTAVCRARLCNGWIYRQFAVRSDLALMVAPIWQRHGRTCWCLRHTPAAAAVVAGWMIRSLDVLREGGGGARRGRVHAIIRRGSGRR